MKMRHIRLILMFVGCWVLSLAAESPEENLIHATFKIYNTASTGTGFLLRDPSPTATPTNVILVTAAHVFTKTSSDSALLVCRVLGEDGWKRMDHKIKIRDDHTNALWTAHATQDVAVIRCTLPPNAKFFALPITAIATEAAAQAADLTVGSRLFYFGFPFRIEANKAAFPLLREAVVTAYPLFPVVQYPTLFITAPTFAGDSGAPVALRQPNTSIPLVVGIVISRTQQNDKFSNDDWTINFKRDMNLGSFVQAHYIHETLKLLD